MLRGHLQRGKFPAAPPLGCPPYSLSPSSCRGLFSAPRLSDQLAATPTWLSAQVPPCERAL
jgi:hypothetical protein